MEISLRDNGGRRSGRDRRQFSYAGHIPERRSGHNRRSGMDRRIDEHSTAGVKTKGSKERRRALA